MTNEVLNSSGYWLGAIVFNSVFGTGRVIGYRQRYREAQVAFEDITLWIGTEDLSKVTPPKSQKSEEPVSLKQGIKREAKQLKSLRIIEALKLGVVPEREIEEFTFHREYEIKQVQKNFEQIEKTGGASAIILGEYGSGKSHFLDLIRTMALKKGYVVAKAEMDAYEVRPHRPKRLYRALMSTIKWEIDGSPVQLRDFIMHCLNHEEAIVSMKDHRFLYPLFTYIINHSSQVNDILWDFVEGNELRLDYVRKALGYGSYAIPALYDSAYAADLYCYILTGISILARSAGFKGLVILIDEGESIYMVDSNENVKANNFIKGLMSASMSVTEQNGKLFHSLKRKYYPYSYAIKNYLYTVIAMTPRMDDTDQPEWLKEAAMIELSYFDEEDMQAMFDKLLSIYKTAYPDFQPESIEDLNGILYSLWYTMEREDLRFRQALKALVEALDIKRHYPRRKISIPKLKHAQTFA